MCILLVVTFVLAYLSLLLPWQTRQPGNVKSRSWKTDWGGLKLKRRRWKGTEGGWISQQYCFFRVEHSVGHDSLWTDIESGTAKGESITVTAARVLVTEVHDALMGIAEDILYAFVLGAEPLAGGKHPQDHQLGAICTVQDGERRRETPGLPWPGAQNQSQRKGRQRKTEGSRERKRRGEREAGTHDGDEQAGPGRVHLWVGDSDVDAVTRGSPERKSCAVAFRVRGYLRQSEVLLSGALKEGKVLPGRPQLTETCWGTVGWGEHL